MVHVTYSRLDAGLLSLFSVRCSLTPDENDLPRLTERFYPPFPDNTVVCFKVLHHTTRNSRSFLHLTIHLPEKPQRQEWPPHSSRTTVSLCCPPSLPRARSARLGSVLWTTLLCLDGQSTRCRDFGCLHCQGLAGYQWRDLLQSKTVLHEEPDDTSWSSHHRNTLQRYLVSFARFDVASINCDGSARAGGSTAGSPCSFSPKRPSKVTRLFSIMKPTS